MLWLVRTMQYTENKRQKLTRNVLYFAWLKSNMALLWHLWLKHWAGISVSTLTRLRLHGRTFLVWFPTAKIFVFANVSRPALRPTQPHSQRVRQPTSRAQSDQNKTLAKRGAINSVPYMFPWRRT